MCGRCSIIHGTFKGEPFVAFQCSHDEMASFQLASEFKHEWHEQQREHDEACERAMDADLEFDLSEEAAATDSEPLELLEL